MITGSDIEWCRDVLLREGRFSEDTIDTIVELARQTTIQTVADPNRGHLLDAAAAIISLDSEGLSDENIKDGVENAIKRIIK